MPASRRSSSRALTTVALGLGLVLLGPALTGCGADDGRVGVTVTDGVATAGGRASGASSTAYPDGEVPPPSGKVVLVVTGGTTTNVGDELRLDLAQLDALPQVEYAVDDDLATGTRATFSGPLVSSVLALAGAEDGTTLHTGAINDYFVDVPAADARDLPLMLATRMDGKRMSVANYGPTRFIYPTEGYGLDPIVYDARWIWQLRSIEVE